MPIERRASRPGRTELAGLPWRYRNGRSDGRDPSSLDDMDFLELARRRVVIYDGATGTYLQALELTGRRLRRARPRGLQRAARRHPARRHPPDCTSTTSTAGADVVETEHVRQLRRAARRVRHRRAGLRAVGRGRALARSAADQVIAADPTGPASWPARSAPAPSSPSLGQIRYADLRDTYEEQCRGPARRRRRPAARRDPVRPARPQGRHERRPPGHAGRRAGGADPGAGHDRARPAACCPAPRSAPPSPPSTRCGPTSSGINCATGPAEMGEHLRYLCQHARTPVSCLPNAGLPSVKDGHMHYDLTPDQLADYHARFITELRRHRHRRLLRHDARAHPRPGRALRAICSRPSAQRPVGARGHVDLLRSPPSSRTPRS